MKRLHVIGQKNHGKTTLVGELIRTLADRGQRKMLREISEAQEDERVQEFIANVLKRAERKAKRPKKKRRRTP